MLITYLNSIFPLKQKTMTDTPLKTEVKDILSNASAYQTPEKQREYLEKSERIIIEEYELRAKHEILKLRAMALKAEYFNNECNYIYAQGLTDVLAEPYLPPSTIQQILGRWNFDAHYLQGLRLNEDDAFWLTLSYSSKVFEDGDERIEQNKILTYLLTMIKAETLTRVSNTPGQEGSEKLEEMWKKLQEISGALDKLSDSKDMGKALPDQINGDADWLKEDIDPDMKKLWDSNEDYSYSSKSTSSINQFTIKNLKRFWEESNLKSEIKYPLSIKTTLTFFDYLAYTRKVALGTITDCVFRSLIRLTLRSHQTVSDEWRRACVEKFNCYKADPKVKQPGKGNIAITVAVWNCILDRTDCTGKFYIQTVSYIAFALATGSRGITVSSIRLCDILDLIWEPDRRLKVVINRPVTKGNPFFNQVVTIGGFPEGGSSSLRVPSRLFQSGHYRSGADE